MAERHDIDTIDRVVHEPVRFRLLSCLFVVESADFLFLTRQLKLTQGNLSSHMTRLEAAGYIDVEKTVDNRRPRTLLRLTPAGRRALEAYVSGMQQLLDTVEVPARKRTNARRPQRPLKPRTV